MIIKKQFKRHLSTFMATLSILILSIQSVCAAEPINDIEETLNSLTLHEKVCQMFIMYQQQVPTVQGDGYVNPFETGVVLEEALKEYPIGGFLYDASNMKTHEQLTQLIETANSYSRIPLIFSVDEEGGRVARIGKTLGYTRGPILDAMGTYSTKGTKTAYDNARFIGLNIADHGFNLDFAPVADTDSNPNNTVIGTRAYSKDFDEASKLVGSAVLGFKSVGVGTTLKHFPGHGDTSEDSHTGAAYVHKSLAELRLNELKPFRAGIQNGTDAVMIGHIIVDEVGEPSVFSKKIVTNLLKEEMGYEGLIVTDGLQMKAMTDFYTTEEIVINGINSGIDIFLCISDLPTAVEAIKKAVLDGTLTEDRIDESVRKILTFKQNH